MKKIIALLAVIALAGCNDPEPIGFANTGNNKISAKLIAVVEGCRIFRIEGEHRYVYFAKCGDTAVTTRWSENCGKNCIRDTGMLGEES